MPNLLVLLTQFHLYLDGVSPGLFNAFVGGTAVLAIYLLKKFAPSVFNRLPPQLQLLPAMVWSGVLGALGSAEPSVSGVIHSFSSAAILGGIFGIGTHHALKESPLPYGGVPGMTKKESLRAPPIIGTGAMIFFLSLLGAIACTAAQKQDAKNAIDLTNGACINLSGLDTSGKAESICAIEEELAPIVKHLLAARAYRKSHITAVHGGAPLDACTISEN